MSTSAKYSVHKVGGFGLGRFKSLASAKRTIKATGEHGLWQIVDVKSGVTVFEKWMK